MNLTKTMYDNNKIDAEKVINTYSMLADYLDAQIKDKPDDQRTVQVKRVLMPYLPIPELPTARTL